MRKNLLGFAALVAAAAMLLVPASNAAKPSGPTPEVDAYQQVYGHSALVASTTFVVS